MRDVIVHQARCADWVRELEPANYPVTRVRFMGSVVTHVVNLCALIHSINLFHITRHHNSYGGVPFVHSLGKAWLTRERLIYTLAWNRRCLLKKKKLRGAKALRRALAVINRRQIENVESPADRARLLRAFTSIFRSRIAMAFHYIAIFI